MSFFNNTGVDLKEHEAGSIITAGTTGKFIFDHDHVENRRVVDSHEIVRMVPKNFDFALSINHSNMTDEEIKAYINEILSDNPSSMYNMVKGVFVKEEWDLVCDTHMRTYMTVSLSEITKETGLKRAEAIRRRACKACAFNDHCNKAPRCGAKHTTDEAAQVYFKMGQDTIIDTKITARTNITDTTVERANHYNMFYDTNKWYL